MIHADFLGLLAGALVLATFATTDMRRLRILAVFSNIAFLSYAAALGLWPVLVLHALLLPVNLAMLVRHSRSTQKDGPVAGQSLYALPATPRHIRPRASFARQSRHTTSIRQE